MNNVTVIGSLNQDICVRTERIPSVGETLLGRSIEYNCGGKGGNQAYACAQAGAEVIMLGAVGNDANGTVLADSLQSVGVDVSKLLRLDSAVSGTAIVTVDDAGNNTITVIPGANAMVSSQYIQSQREILKKSKVALLQLETPLPTVYSAVKAAKEEGCFVVLNPAPAQSLDREYLQLVDCLTPNEKELALLCPGEDSLEDKAKHLIDRGIKHMVVTMGGEGVLYVGQDKQPIYYPARRVDAVDTVGAGDCFNGYFSAAIAAGKTMSEAVQEAVTAASISVTRSGAQQSFPQRREIETLL